LIISGAAYLGIMTQPDFLAALRAALTIAFVYFGLRKLTGHSTDVAIYEAIGFGQFPRYVTGSVEVFGAALLWWRGWEGIAGLLLLATMITGLSALLIWVGPTLSAYAGADGGHRHRGLCLPRRYAAQDRATAGQLTRAACTA